jgi:hypothetical protein
MVSVEHEGLPDESATGTHQTADKGGYLSPLLALPQHQLAELFARFANLCLPRRQRKPPAEPRRTTQRVSTHSLHRARR